MKMVDHIKEAACWDLLRAIMDDTHRNTKGEIVVSKGTEFDAKQLMGKLSKFEPEYHKTTNDIITLALIVADARLKECFFSKDGQVRKLIKLAKNKYSTMAGHVADGSCCPDGCPFDDEGDEE